MLALHRLQRIDPHVRVVSARDLDHSVDVLGREVPRHRAHDDRVVDAVGRAEIERLARLPVQRGAAVGVVLLGIRAVERDVDVVEQRHDVPKELLELQQRDAARRQADDDARVGELLDDVRQQRVGDLDAVREDRLVAAEVHRLDAEPRQLADDPLDHPRLEVGPLAPGAHRVAVRAAVRALVAERPADVLDRHRALRQLRMLDRPGARREMQLWVGERRRELGRRIHGAASSACSVEPPSCPLRTLSFMIGHIGK